MMTKLRNNQGVAMVATLYFFVILTGLSVVFTFRIIHESAMAKYNRQMKKALYTAQGGAEVAINQVDTLINDYLLNTIASANPSGVVSYASGKVASGDGIGWLVYAVRDNNVPVLTLSGEEATYSANGTLNSVAYSYTITITEKSDPASSGPDAWDFPYSYRIASSSTAGNVTKNVIISGDFTVQVQKDNFAKFALFTNTQTTQGGTNVWFTDRTNFSGPVHTNDRFNFALNPSATFQATVTEVQQLARYYNGGATVLLDAAANGTTDVPTFEAGFTRGVSSVTLSSATQQQDMIDQAKGNGNYGSNGIYVPANGPNLSAGIYVRGDSTINMSVDGSNNAVYTITQGGTTKIVTVNEATQQTSVQDLSSGSSQTYNGLPDGEDDVGTLIYVDGNLTSLGGTVQSDTELTIASTSDMVITNHVQYQDYTAASGTPGTVGYVPPSAIGFTNMLGLVSWGGNVRIGTAAPNDINIHGTVLAQNGVVQVDSYNSGSPRGTATLLGGIISDDYGAFGTFNGSTGLQASGYGRNFVYDDRMELGNSPPYFPSLSTFVAFTNDITDKLVWQEGI